LFTEGVVWHVPGRSPLTGDYEGVDAVIGYFVETMERSSGSFRVKVHDVLANDNHTVGLHVASGERDGKRLEDSQVLVIHVRDGKIASVWQHSSDQYSQDDFWS
jgi:ketosteroid isomerase-like protein